MSKTMPYKVTFFFVESSANQDRHFATRSEVNRFLKVNGHRLMDWIVYDTVQDKIVTDTFLLEKVTRE